MGHTTPDMRVSSADMINRRTASRQRQEGALFAPTLGKQRRGRHQGKRGLQFVIRDPHQGRKRLNRALRTNIDRRRRDVVGNDTTSDSLRRNRTINCAGGASQRRKQRGKQQQERQRLITNITAAT